MDELRRRLKKEKVWELLDHADKLGLGDQSGLNKDPLIEFIIEKGDHIEIGLSLKISNTIKRRWI